MMMGDRGRSGKLTAHACEPLGMPMIGPRPPRQRSSHTPVPLAEARENFRYLGHRDGKRYTNVQAVGSNSQSWVFLPPGNQGFHPQQMAIEPLRPNSHVSRQSMMLGPEESAQSSRMGSADGLGYPFRPRQPLRPRGQAEQSIKRRKCEVFPPQISHEDFKLDSEVQNPLQDLNVEQFVSLGPRRRKRKRNNGATMIPEEEGGIPGKNIVYIRTGLDGAYQIVDNNSMQVFGVPSEYWKGKNGWDFVQKEDIEMMEKGIVLMAKGKSHMDYRFRMILPDGATMFCEMHVIMKNNKLHAWVMPLSTKQSFAVALAEGLQARAKSLEKSICLLRNTPLSGEQHAIIKDAEDTLGLMCHMITRNSSVPRLNLSRRVAHQVNKIRTGDESFLFLEEKVREDNESSRS